MNITEKIAQVLVPKEILKDFLVVDVHELKNEWLLVLEEKAERIPKSLECKDVVLDGFYDSIDLISGVLMDQVIYLRIRRRRWKERGNTKGSKIAHGFNGTDDHYIIKITQANGHIFWRTKIEYHIEIPEGGQLTVKFPFEL
jgi:hypothetical protein